jgi:hypothetical protein
MKQRLLVELHKDEYQSAHWNKYQKAASKLMLYGYYLFKIVGHLNQRIGSLLLTCTIRYVAMCLYFSIGINRYSR